MKLCEFQNVEDRQDYMLQRITHDPIVIIGASETAKDFLRKYYKILNIKCVLTNSANEEELVLSENIKYSVQPYSKDMISDEDLIIVCRKDIGSWYSDIKKRLVADGFVCGDNFIIEALARAIIEKKRIFTVLGYCHGLVITQIFKHTSAVNSHLINFYSYLTDIDESSYKYSDIITNIALSNIVVYVPHFGNMPDHQKCLPEYAAENAVRFKYPQLSFRGLSPYKSKDLRAGNQYFNMITSGSGHPPRPFQYSIPCIDRLIEEGKSNEEICSIVLDRNFIPEEEIKKNFNIAMRGLEINESKSNLKIVDYIKENYQHRLMYRDCLHYEYHMYMEIARRMAQTLSLCDTCEIDAVEEEIKHEGRNFIGWLNITEEPILPCVEQALGIEFADDSYKYSVRLGDDHTDLMLDRKEWIELYCECIRAAYVLRKVKII